MTRKELIAALERAEGPSAELDAAIAPYGGWIFAKSVIRYAMGSGLDAWVKTDGSGKWEINLPRYTASVDAALTLLPEGHRALIYTTGAARVWPIDGKRCDELSYGCTPAIGVCIAALKAMGDA